MNPPLSPCSSRCVYMMQQHAEAPEQADSAGLCGLSCQVSFVQVLKVESTGLMAGRAPMESTPMENTVMASLTAMATHMMR